MRYRILITGSCGLVGTALRQALEARGIEVIGLDIAAQDRQEKGDVCKRAQVEAALEHCHGVVHLAAVSRVIWGEKDPDHCRCVNIGGLSTLLDAVAHQPVPPWVIFASSREVYGQPQQLPANEDAPWQAFNVYGETKIAGEKLINKARENSLRTTIVRLSNVYGNVDDHRDRVVPAFARAAALGKTLHVEGAGNTFDFTHIDDVTHGLLALIKRMQLEGDQLPPPVHLLTGQPTTLGELAQLAVELAGTRAPIVEAPPRDYDVARFYGDPGRARELLGWSAQVTLRDGLARLIQDFREAVSTSPTMGGMA